MARNKRTAPERQRDIERLADLYCRGQTQTQMAEAFGVCRKQIYYDLHILNKQWQESAVGRFEERKARELAKIDHLEAIAWTAWERSCQDAESNTSSIVQGRTGKEEEVLPDQTRALKTVTLPDLKRVAKTVKGQAGDPRFLERVAWCIDRRCEIIGVNAEQERRDRQIPDYHEHKGSLTTEERAEAIAALRELLAPFPEARQKLSEFVYRRLQARQEQP